MFEDRARIPTIRSLRRMPAILEEGSFANESQANHHIDFAASVSASGLSVGGYGSGVNKNFCTGLAGTGWPINQQVAGADKRRRVRQLRDPAFFKEGARNYLLYSIAGESGLAIAEVRESRRSIDR